ncbi:hypothetical protein C7C56_012770, partial [Massilia glaciei]
AAAPPAPPPQAPKPPPLPAGPPRRQPVRLRYWLLALGVLWLIWLGAKPDTRRTDARVNEVIALAADCKLPNADAEMVMLKTEGARAVQIERVQEAIDKAKPRCERIRLRAAAWKTASAAVDGALREGTFTKARAALAGFARKWGDDANTRALHTRIDKEQQRAQDAESVQRLVGEARSDVARGDYSGATRKMEVCVLMVDADHSQCIALRDQANRLRQAMLRCVAGGNEWFGYQCRLVVSPDN